MAQHKAPPEILGLIFGEVVESIHHDDLPGMSCDSQSPLWGLCLVCRDWRVVATGTPSLWASVYVRPRHDAHVDLAHEFHLLRSWLKNAGTHPLALYLDVPDRESTFLDKFASIFGLLVEYSRQWQCLKFRGTPDILSYFSQLRGQLESLTFLQIDTSPRAVLASIDTFLVAPELQVVRLLGCSHLLVRLPYSQLTEFMGGEDNVGIDVGSWLTPFAQLTSAVFAMPGDPFRTTRIDFPALESLQITFPNLLPHIKAPRLTSLTVDDPACDECRICVAFLEATPLLQAFAIRDWGGSLAVFRALPQSVTKLSVELGFPKPLHSRAPLRLLYRMLGARDGESKPALAYLESLELTVPCLLDLGMDTLKHFVTNRSARIQSPPQAFRHLQSLQIVYRADYNDEQLYDFKPLEEMLEVGKLNLGPILPRTRYRHLSMQQESRRWASGADFLGRDFDDSDSD